MVADVVGDVVVLFSVEVVEVYGDIGVVVVNGVVPGNAFDVDTRLVGTIEKGVACVFTGDL